MLEDPTNSPSSRYKKNGGLVLIYGSWSNRKAWQKNILLAPGLPVKFYVSILVCVRIQKNRGNSIVSELTPRKAGQRSGSTVADVSDPARSATQEVPRLLAVVTAKHCRHRCHWRPFTSIRPQVAAESHPHARWSHKRLATELCSTRCRCRLRTLETRAKVVGVFLFKNLAIANRWRISCSHNTLRASIGLNITPWPWNLG